MGSEMCIRDRSAGALDMDAAVAGKAACDSPWEVARRLGLGGGVCLWLSEASRGAGPNAEQKALLRKTRCVIRVRLWRARHATKTIAKFLYDNRFYAPIIKFKNCVRAIQAQVRSYLACKAARVLMLERFWLAREPSLRQRLVAEKARARAARRLSLIHISEPTRP